MLMMGYEMVVVVDRADDTGLHTYLLDVEKTEAGREVADSILDCLWARTHRWH